MVEAGPKLVAARQACAGCHMAPTAQPQEPLRSPSSRPPIEERRARPLYRVFVSSTWLDLQLERRSLMDALNRMEEMRFVGMEFFGNRPDDTHDASIDQVDLCEVFVGIIGHRYGSGITAAEYRRARERGLPCFVYFKRGDTARPELTDGDAALAAKLAEFKQDLMRSHTVKEFGSPEELAANATADLHNWVAARWISLDQGAATESRPAVAGPNADRTNILRLLERIQHDWVEGVLEASLHHRAWLELGLDWKEDAVEHPWDRIVVAPNRPIRTLGANDSITGVFDAAQNTLLVLGEPGAGKTTTLLELARDLIARARTSTDQPAPVVLALSTWTGASRDLAGWLVAELGLRYQVPKRLARAWIDDARLVLLLDGLDEVLPERRAACVEAINAFEQAHHPPGLAVTCRVAEYDALAVKLRLRAAICLQPLTPEQVGRYLTAAGAGLEPLACAMRDDAGLRELARTPLMLSVMTMAWRETPGVDVRVCEDSPEARRRQVFDAYVHAATHRRGKATASYSAEQTVRSLSWLARRMKEYGHTLFAVEQLQPTWLDGVGRQAAYFLATRLCWTVGLGVIWLLLSGPRIPPDFYSQGGLVLRVVAPLLALSIGLGLAMAGMDLAFVRHGPERGKMALSRLTAMMCVAVIATMVWDVLNGNTGRGGKSSVIEGLGVVYLIVAGLAFCAPVDVRSLDIQPTDTMRWSWRQALDRFLAGLIGVSLVVGFGYMALVSLKVVQSGWPAAVRKFGVDWFLFGGIVLGAAVAACAWWRLRPKWNANLVAVGLAFLSHGGQVGSLFGPGVKAAAGTLIAGLVTATLIGFAGGFAAGMMDPARARRTGIWFWLRVPTLAFFVTAFLVAAPLFAIGYPIWSSLSKGLQLKYLIEASIPVTVIALVAFIRFGGFSGMQHFVLRWLLVRSGDLPPKADSFFNHAAQLALMQKVGFGYRFIHALLLDHLAGPAIGRASNKDSPARGDEPARSEI